MHAKYSQRKGCMLFSLHIYNDKSKSVKDAKVFSKYPILQHFQDVFPVDISEFPPHREVEFSIYLVPGVAPTSRAPYRMSTQVLVELML